MTIDCHKCLYYFVTWDETFPHGCKAMGFKSGRYPIDAVRSAVRGKDCLIYKPKRRKKRRE